MLFVKKCWDWCVEHWKLTLAFIGGIIAFVLGYLHAMRDPPRENPMNDIVKKDNDLMKKKYSEQEDFVQKKALDFIEHKKKIEANKKEKLKIAEKDAIELREDLVNKTSELDKILQDKWDLKKE